MARPRDPVETRIGVLTGWRCWIVRKPEGLLRPIYMSGLAWKPRQPYEAVCAERLRDAEQHAVPSEGCKCGVWAVCHPMLLQEVHWKEHAGKVIVVGQVSLWGTVLEFERGWRAQFAYPTQLYAFTEDELLATILREKYQVPVAWGSEADALAQILPPGLRRRSATAGAPTVVPGIPVTMPAVVDMVHAQEVDALEEARAALRLEQAAIERERQALEIDRQRHAAERERLALERRRAALAVDTAKLESARISSQASREFNEHAARGAELKASLVQRGITQDHIARMAGVTRSMVCDLLAGRTRSEKITRVIQQLLQGGTAEAPRPALSQLRDRLSALGITQRQIARQAMVSDAHVSKVLGGGAMSQRVLEVIDRLLAANAVGPEQRRAALKSTGHTYDDLARQPEGHRG